jgi:NADH-quinone oxidoreductase subunit E
MKQTTTDLDALLERYPGEPRRLISLLQDVQAEYNYISPEAMSAICQHVGVPLTQAWSVATFYSAFSLQPKGEHIIKVCLGTACHLKGSGRLVDNLCRDLSIDPGETTKDLKFTVETVNCLGACALAPVVVMDGKYYGGMNSAKMDKLINRALKE